MLTRHRWANRVRDLADSLATRALALPHLWRLTRVVPGALRRRLGGVLGRGPDVRDGSIRGVATQVASRLRDADAAACCDLDRTDNVAEWEVLRDERLRALRASLGVFPPRPERIESRITGTLEGDGFHIDNLVFESRPGISVPANLYRPSAEGRSRPGILICHSHHNPKTQDELQDMGVIWARCGCVVLIMDQLGHGERREHPFASAVDYVGPFRCARQDYFFRYNLGIQLHLIGDSLMGWMVWDVMRAIDLLIGRPDVDSGNIIVIGSVAGGGDIASTTAALDSRIRTLIAFNFGGPKRGPTLEIPDLDDTARNLTGSGSWESTRNLRLSAVRGFPPWAIVASAAPRSLVYAHEFSWDRDSDPVWAALTRLYELYGAPDGLAAVHGRGRVTGRPPENTHCNNVGPIHREQLYPLLKRWHGIPQPDREDLERRSPDELSCLRPGVVTRTEANPARLLASTLGIDRLADARKEMAGLAPGAWRARFRGRYSEILGGALPTTDPRARTVDRQDSHKTITEEILLGVEDAIDVPLTLLTPRSERPAAYPLVVAVAQAGRKQMLRRRARLIERLLLGGAAVCVPDLRGTGDPGRGDEHRGRRSLATRVSSSELMLGETLVGARLRDLRGVVRWLRSHPDLDARRIVLWGDSLAPVNRPDRDLAVPHDADPYPELAEPLGVWMALLGALYEDDVRAVYSRGGLSGFLSLLDSPFVYVPHDVIVPGVLRVGDLCDIAAILAPRPIRIEGPVDGRNVPVDQAALEETFAPARRAYLEAGAADRLAVHSRPAPEDVVAEWILDGLRNST